MTAMNVGFVCAKVALGLAVVGLPTHAAVVNLTTWTAESYAAVSGFGAGVWTVAGGGGSVTQSVNGQPTMFYSDFNAQGTTVSGKIRVTGSDDDYVGFVLGFNPGSSTSSTADYLLVDWKRGTQFFDFGAPSSSPGGNALSGLAVSRVSGIPDADEFWQHKNLGGTSATNGVTELARGATLGATGWNTNTDYTFKFDFGPNNLRVYVDNVLQLDVAGSFADGRMGFYNFSQAGVTYSAFSVDPGPFPPRDPNTSVPDSGSASVLMGLALGGLALLRRKMA